MCFLVFCCIKKKTFRLLFVFSNRLGSIHWLKYSVDMSWLRIVHCFAMSRPWVLQLLFYLFFLTIGSFSFSTKTRSIGILLHKFTLAVVWATILVFQIALGYAHLNAQTCVLITIAGRTGIVNYSILARAKKTVSKKSRFA